MVYFFHRKILSAILYKQEFACDQLVIQMEFTEAGQMDGHMPAHGDMERDFAEALIRNIPQEELLQIFKDNDIKGFKRIFNSCSATVIKTNRFENFMPVMIMELRLAFSPEVDPYVSAVNQLLDSIPWEPVKTAIANPEQ